MPLFKIFKIIFLLAVTSCSKNYFDISTSDSDSDSTIIIEKIEIPFMKQLGNSTPNSDQSEHSNRVVVDDTGNSYHIGRTTGSIYDTNGGSNDILIVKANPKGSVLW